MTDDLNTLRPEVQKALHGLRKCVLRCEPSLDVGLATIRAELLRLANENADLQLRKEVDIEQSVEDHKWHCDEEDRLRDRAEKVEAELAALKARIADAPVTSTGNLHLFEYHAPFIGKRVRLLVEE